MDSVQELPKTPKIVSAQENVVKMGSDYIEDNTMLELGYVQVYRRVLRSAGNMCMVIALTSWVTLQCYVVDSTAY